MFEILVLIVMSIAAIRAANSLRKDRALFQEFGARETLIPLIYLFPVGPLILLLLPMVVGLPIAVPLALACYLPVLYFLKPARHIFERSGTDRTKSVQEALSIVFISAVGGIVYVVARTGIAVLVDAGSGLR